MKEYHLFNLHTYTLFLKSKLYAYCFVCQKRNTLSLDINFHGPMDRFLHLGCPDLRCSTYHLSLEETPSYLWLLAVGYLLSAICYL